MSSDPEEFQWRLQHALHGLTGVAVAADDILVYGVGKTMEEARLNHDENLVQLLHRAREQRGRNKLEQGPARISHHVPLRGVAVCQGCRALPPFPGAAHQ